MPASLKSTGSPDPKLYTIGRGRLFISKLKASGFPDGRWRDLGNVPSFSLNISSEDLEHTSSRSGLRTTDRKIVISQDVGFSLTMEEVNLDNLALYLSGDQDAIAQGVLAITGDKNLAVVEKGRWYDVYDVADMTAGGYPQGNKVFNLTSGTVVVTSDDGVTTYVEGTDYDVDYIMGMIFIKPTGSIPAGTEGAPTVLDVDFDGVATSLERVRGVTVADQTFALRFLSENANNADDRRLFHIHAGTLIPDGDFNLISDEWGQMTFTGSAQKRENVDANSPTVTVTTVVS